MTLSDNVIDLAAHRARRALPPSRPAPPMLRPGDEVRVTRTGARGTVLAAKIDPARGRLLLVSFKAAWLDSGYFLPAELEPAPPEGAA